MDLRQISDDFFTIGNIAVLKRDTGDGTYDFDFRSHFDCKSVVSAVDVPVLLHIGAIEDYAGAEAALKERGMKLLVHEGEHLRCSTIEHWYPALKERTPFTIVYDRLPDVEEILRNFSFPVFIQGNRQTNRHRRSQCIVEDAEQYQALREAWKRDSVLSRQKAAVREYMPLLEVDSGSHPDQVLICYAFRFFYFEGKCMAYGPCWRTDRPYALPEGELPEVLRLTDWAAERLGVIFPAIDVAKTASGEWIIIEVNDAQESGFAGANPLVLWNNTIRAMQNRTWMDVDPLFEEGTVVMGADPLPGRSPEDMRTIARHWRTTQELVDAYAEAYNKYWWVEDDEYDFEEGTEGYQKARAIAAAWRQVTKLLEEQILACAMNEGLLEKRPDIGLIRRLEAFMKKYGYRDGRGWWVRT